MDIPQTVHKEEREGYEHITDGYYKYTDIVFEWAKVLDPWHANAVTAVIHNSSLLHPDNPLSDGKGGIILYIGIDAEDHKRFLFSLKQIDYMRYWIHQMKLAQPKHVMELARHRDSLNNPPGGTVKGEDEVSYDDIEVDEWIPLPSTILKPSLFVKMEEHRFTDYKQIKRVVAQMRKRSQPLDDLEGTRLAAYIDNNFTPGPGLRRGPMRRRESRPRRELDLGVQDGVGWGGFPLQESKPSVDVQEALNKVKEEEATKPVVDEKIAASLSAADTKVSSLPDDVPPSSDQKPQVPRLPSQSPPQPQQKDLAAYHHHVEQALILASQGGLAGVFKHDPTVPSDAGIFDATRKKIGRSLFLALDICIWEGSVNSAQEEDVVLDVGWAGIWFQERLAGLSGQEGDGDADMKDHESGDRYEEVRDLGHWVIHDNLLERRNTPDQRSKYHFGTSLPIPKKELKSTIERKILDLSRKAGGGPIYIIHYSTRALKGLDGLLDTTKWGIEFQPPGTEYPSYASEAGVGSTTSIDISKLHAAITDSTVSEGEISSLEEMGRFLFSGEEDKEMIDIRNSGNAAVYTLESFIHMATTPLQDLREQFRISTNPSAQKATSSQELSEMEKDHYEGIKKLAKIMDSQSRYDEDDEDEDSEDDHVKGVFVEGEDGEMMSIW